MRQRRRHQPGHDDHPRRLSTSSSSGSRPTLVHSPAVDEHDDLAAGLAAANRFFNGLLEGDLTALQGVSAPGSILWINLTEQERALEASLPGFAKLKGKVPDLHMDGVK